MGHKSATNSHPCWAKQDTLREREREFCWRAVAFVCLLLWITNSIFPLTLMFVVNCVVMHCDAMWALYDCVCVWMSRIARYSLTNTLTNYIISGVFWALGHSMRINSIQNTKYKSDEKLCTRDFVWTRSRKSTQTHIDIQWIVSLGIILQPLFIFIVGCSNNSRLGFRLEFFFRPRSDCCHNRYYLLFLL